MQAIRGLLRQPMDAAAAKAFENALSQKQRLQGVCFVNLQTLAGKSQTVPVIHDRQLESLMQSLSSTEEKLKRLSEYESMVRLSVTESGVDVAAMVDIRGDLQNASAAVCRRNTRTLGLMRGRVLSQDLTQAEEFLESVADVTPRKSQHTQAGSCRSEWDVATFHGLLLGLSRSDAALTTELAASDALPALNGAVGAACAKLVPLVAPNFVEVFDTVRKFTTKDEWVVSQQSVATALALRLRALMWADDSSPDVKDAASKALARLGSEFRVDLTTVFSSDVRAIQMWAAKATAECKSPAEKGRVLLDRLLAQDVSLKSSTSDAVSLVAMSDVESAWLRAAVAPVPPPASPSESPCANRQQRHEIRRQQAIHVALQDPKRWLVDSRLLNEYADLLAKGFLSCRDKSFAGFLEEVGECHRGEHPASITFEVNVASRAPRQLASVLVSLAPQCSYWTTLITKLWSTHVTITEPSASSSSSSSNSGSSSSSSSSSVDAACDIVTVTVTFPQHHECMLPPSTTAISSNSANSSTVGTVNTSTTPPPVVLFEDDAIVAFYKDASMPVSRHALCRTQSGDATMTDVVSVVLLSKQYEHLRNASDVLRGGLLHRLDKQTTGVLLFAKTRDAMQCMRHQMGTSAQFGLAAHQYPKVYHALVVVITADWDKIATHGVLRDSRDSRVTTRYQIVKFFPASRMALVECRIHQGKKHQIRRHLAQLGMPILQDVEYGGAVCCSPLMQRVALHASSVTFVHPVSQRVMTVQAPLPEDMRNALAVLASR